jgi:DNA-directed RNA polymerase specialized sigma24 family protein
VRKDTQPPDLGEDRSTVNDDSMADQLDVPSRLVPAPYLSSASFVAALRLAEPAALRALFSHFAPLLRDQARVMGVAPDERSELVTTLLDDFVLKLHGESAAPRDLGRYLVSALRNRARNLHRAAARRAAATDRALVVVDGTTQHTVAESHSEWGVRLARGEGDVAPAEGAMSRAIRKLAEFSAQRMTPEESALAIGVSRHVPMRELAAQAGISYSAARVRLHRLREKFRRLVLQHVQSLELEERREMLRFLRRAGIALDVPDITPRSARGTTRPMQGTAGSAEEDLDDTV